MQELADHHAATWAKVATFMSDTCLMIFGLSLFIGMLELWLRGVDFPAFLGLYIVASSLVAILFTLYEMRIHNTATVAARMRQFDIYIWGIFVLIPVSVTGFLMCNVQEACPHEDFLRLSARRAPEPQKECSCELRW